jgi:hypothetical protein
MPSWKKVIISGSNAVINDITLSGDATTIGSDFTLANTTGDLTITNNANDKDIILKSDDGSGGVAAYLTLDGSATQTLLHQDTVLTGGKKLYIAGNTYITEASSDILDFYVGGVKMYTIDETNNLLTMRGTGGSDGAAGSPTLRLSNTVASGDWDTDDVVGAIEYFAEDTSGNAPYVTSFIKSVNGVDGSNGTLPGGELSFGVATYNLSGGAVEKMRLTGAGNLNLVGNISGSQIEASGDVIAFGSSDERLKDNITYIHKPIDKINKIGGYKFTWNNKQDTYLGKDVGVLAQEIEAVLPEVVTTRATGYKAVKYEKIVPLLIEGIKELDKKIKHIEKNCDCLNN